MLLHSFSFQLDDASYHSPAMSNDLFFVVNYTVVFHQLRWTLRQWLWNCTCVIWIWLASWAETAGAYHSSAVTRPLGSIPPEKEVKNCTFNPRTTASNNITWDASPSLVDSDWSGRLSLRNTSNLRVQRCRLRFPWVFTFSIWIHDGPTWATQSPQCSRGWKPAVCR